MLQICYNECMLFNKGKERIKMTEDLSTTTFEERQFFWDNRFQIEKRQSAEESLKMQEAVEKYWKYRSSLTGRIRHFLGIDKPEFKKNPRITEASPEEIQKENASFDFLSNCNSWAGVYKKFDDGLVYYTNEISVQGKSEEEIKYMQQTLQRYGINTQIDIAGSRENKDINASEVFVNLKHWQDNNATIKQGDTVLRITDPIGNQNLPDLFIFTRLPYTGHFIDVSFIPMTMEEYLKHEKRQQENDKLQEARRQDEMEKKEITQMFERAMQAPQKRADLKQFLKTFSDKQNTTDAPVSSQSQPKRVLPLRDPRDGR